MDVKRTDYLIGQLNAQAVAAAYSCGHCNSETSIRTDDHGIVRVAIHHDDGCPVLTGVLPSTPDALRAIAAGAVPDTFRS